MSKLKTLNELKLAAAAYGGEFNSIFKSLHHFSRRPPFRTQPSTFHDFAAYCDKRTHGILAGGENEQTIQRACYFLQVVRSKSTESSVAEAWTNWPLARGT